VKTHPGALAQLGDPGEGAVRGDPHRAVGLAGHRKDGQAPVVQAGPVQVQSGAAQLFGGLDRLLGGAQQLGRAVLVGQGAADVAGHGRETGRSAGEGIQVVPGPVPDLHLEARLVNALGPLVDRQVPEDHLGADRQRVHRHWPLSF
jgi:hypothetical protein